MTATPVTKISFEEYLNYDDGTNNRYELVEGKLVLMPPASFLHSDIIDFIADLIKMVVRENKLDIKVKTVDVGIRTGIDSSRIPDILVIDGQLWRSYRRDKSAVIEDSLLLAVEVVSPGKEQIERDYIEKLAEYRDRGINEYWIVDSIKIPKEYCDHKLVLVVDEFWRHTFDTKSLYSKRFKRCIIMNDIATEKLDISTLKKQYKV